MLMKAFGSLFRIKRAGGRKLFMAAFGFAVLRAFAPSQLKEEPHLIPLPKVDVAKGIGLSSIRQDHPSTLFLPETLPEDVLELVNRCLPGYEKYAIEGDRVCMINSERQYEQFAVGSDKEEWLRSALNFNSPLRVFNREQFDELLQRLETDECIVLTFLPPREEYYRWVGPVEPHDRYTASKIKNLVELQEQFKKLKTQSPTNKAQYLVVNSDELAKRLNLSYQNTGDVYVLRKTSQLMNNQSNFIYGGMRCHMQKVEPPVTSNIDAPDTDFKRQFLGEACLPYISFVNIAQDYRNLLRVAQANGTSKLLVVGIHEDQKAEFQKKIQKVLFELKKVFKQELTILVTRNQQLLKNELHISPDEFVTLRLLDLKSIQKPRSLFSGYAGLEDVAIKPAEPVFSRRIYRGPFRYTELVQFIRSPPSEDYYEDKQRIKLIRPIMPKQLYEVNGLVLYEKRGCQGCTILNSVLEQLQQVVKEIQDSGPLVQDYIFKYKITDPQKLKGLRLYRYNILNEHYHFRSPLTTPQLFYFTDGKQRPLDLHRQEDFTDLKETLRKVVQFVTEL